MNTSDFNNKKMLLDNLLNCALWNTIMWTQSRCKGRPEEPDYIAALSMRFTQYLYHILNAIFFEKKFAVTGVYCHQRPIVDIGYKKMSELGDLLLVYVERDDRGEKLYNSMLLQAKMSDDTEMEIHTNDLHQLELYRYWPKFTYHRFDRLNNQQRDIFPKTICNGAQYLLIDRNADIMDYQLDNRRYPIGCALPDRKLNINNSFSNELIEFLKFKTGRMFDDIHRENDDWSRMIWDLLRVSAAKCSQRKNMGLSYFRRENAYVHLCAGDMEEESLLYTIRNQWEERNYDESGEVPIILIECLRNGEKTMERVNYIHEIDGISRFL